MSQLLDAAAMLDEQRRADCERNDILLRTLTHAHLMNTTRRYPRSLDEAFKTPRYAAAIERPAPSLWDRIVQAVREVLA